MLPTLQRKLTLGITRIFNEDSSGDKAKNSRLDAGSTDGTNYLESLVSCIMMVEEHEDKDAYGPVTGGMLDLLQRLQGRDACTAELCEVLNTPTESASYQQAGWHLAKNDQLLMNRVQIYVPRDPVVRQKLLRSYHDNIWTGYNGVQRTLELLQHKYYWNQIAKDVQKYVSSCYACNMTKPCRHQPYG